MKAKVTYSLYVLAMSFFVVIMGTSHVFAQNSEMVLQNESNIETMIDKMGAEKFLKVARDDASFLKNLKLRTEGMRGMDLETRFMLSIAENESKIAQRKKMRKVVNEKWLESSMWYDVWEESGTLEDAVLSERAYYMYSEDEDGNITQNEIAQYVDGDWMPGYVSSFNLASDTSYYSYKDYYDYASTGWQDIYESEYWIDEMGNLTSAAYYEMYTTEYGEVESENYRSNYSYDESGYRSSIVDQYREGDIWYNEWKGEYNYDAEGAWLGSSYFNWQNGAWEVYREITNAYTEEGFWDEQLVEDYDTETGDLAYKFKYDIDSTDVNGNILVENYHNWDFENQVWFEASYRWLYSYDENGYQTESISQYYDFDLGEWVNSGRTTRAANTEGYMLSSYNYYWDSNTQEWIPTSGYEYEYDENNYRTKDVSKYYYEGVLDYSNTTEYEYDADGYRTKVTYSYSYGETTYFDGYEQYNYTTEKPESTPFINISSLGDRPNDQGGYIEIALDGLLVGSTDINTKYWLVWVKNGENWENIHRSEYFEGAGSTATVPVYDTKPSDEEPGADNSFQFMVTIHGAGGAILGATPSMMGYAEDNIAPAKVNSVSLNSNNVENTMTFTWDAVNAPDVDGYHVYLLEDGEYNLENSLGFTNSTNIEINRPAEQGSYEYVVIAVDENRNFGLASDPVVASFTTSNELEELPVEFKLAQNYPNPFNPSTNISYSLPEAAEVKLSVYDMLGREVATIVNSRKQAGNHTARFDAGSLSSGIYIYRISAGSFSQTRQMMLIK